MTIGGHEKPNKGKTDSWLTPVELVEQLGTFDLDPCEHIIMPKKLAKNGYNINDDGLSKEWTGRVWMNPPYSKNKQFAEKFCEHKNGIALVFARTETEWFKNYYNADAFLFLPQRLTFLNEKGEKPNGNSGAPSVLVAYGEYNSQKLFEYKIKKGGLFLRGEK